MVLGSHTIDKIVMSKMDMMRIHAKPQIIDKEDISIMRRWQ